MQLALIKVWQTAALLILILGFALAPSLPGYLVPLLPLDWLGVLLPFGAGVVAMHLGRHRLGALCGVAGACVSAALFWWMIYVAATGMLAGGLTAATLTAGSLAVALIGVTATITGAAGALWCIGEASPQRALRAGEAPRAALSAHLEG